MHVGQVDMRIAGCAQSACKMTTLSTVQYRGPPAYREAQEQFTITGEKASKCAT